MTSIRTHHRQSKEPWYCRGEKWQRWWRRQQSKARRIASIPTPCFGRGHNYVLLTSSWRLFGRLDFIFNSLRYSSYVTHTPHPSGNPKLFRKYQSQVVKKTVWGFVEILLTMFEKYSKGEMTQFFGHKKRGAGIAYSSS